MNKLQMSLLKMSRNAPLGRNNMFKSSMTDDAFKMWPEKGLRTVEDVYVDGSFGQLKRNIEIPDSHFF